MPRRFTETDAPEADQAHPLWQTAVHEAGHVVAARACGREILAVCIDPKEAWMRHGGPGLTNAIAVFGDMVILAAGAESVRHFLPRADGGDTDDARHLSDHARRLVGLLAPDARAAALVKKAHGHARRLVKRLRLEILDVARALIAAFDAIQLAGRFPPIDATPFARSRP